MQCIFVSTMHRHTMLCMVQAHIHTLRERERICASWIYATRCQNQREGFSEVLGMRAVVVVSGAKFPRAPGQSGGKIAPSCPGLHLPITTSLCGLSSSSSAFFKRAAPGESSESPLEGLLRPSGGRKSSLPIFNQNPEVIILDLFQ